MTTVPTTTPGRSADRRVAAGATASAMLALVLTACAGRAQVAPEPVPHETIDEGFAVLAEIREGADETALRDRLAHLGCLPEGQRILCAKRLASAEVARNRQAALQAELDAAKLAPSVRLRVLHDEARVYNNH